MTNTLFCDAILFVLFFLITLLLLYTIFRSTQKNKIFNNLNCGVTFQKKPIKAGKDIWDEAFILIAASALFFIMYTFLVKVGYVSCGGFLDKLEKQIEEDLTILHIFAGAGALFSLVLFGIRNNAFHKQAESTIQQLEDNKQFFTSQLKIDQEKFNQEMGFKAFLDGTNLLSNDQPIKQIMGINLIYTYASKFPEFTEVVLTAINQLSLPIIKVINTALEEIDGYYYQTDNKRYEIFSKSCKKEIQDMLTSDPVKLKISDSFRTIPVALESVKKILLKYIDEDHKNPLSLSNLLIFNIDTEVDSENITIITNAIKKLNGVTFFHCRIKGISFIEVDLIGCNFIRCDLSECEFQGANLWGSTFIHSNLKDACFKDAKGEGINVNHAENFTPEQLKSMNWSCEQLKSMGWSYKQLKSMDYSCEQLKSMDCSEEEKKIFPIIGKHNPEVKEYSKFETDAEYSRYKNA